MSARGCGRPGLKRTDKELRGLLRARSPMHIFKRDLKSGHGGVNREHEYGYPEMNARTAAILETLEALPEERQREIADFVEFIRQREEQRVKNWQVTVEAMEAAERGETVKFNNLEEFFADLHSDDNADAEA
jgi:hypothetical protein